MVVSRTGGLVAADGSGFWRLSFPQPLDVPSVALPVDSPTAARTVRAGGRASVLHSSLTPPPRPPLALLNNALVHTGDDVIVWLSGSVVKATRHTQNVHFLVDVRSNIDHPEL